MHREKKNDFGCNIYSPSTIQLWKAWFLFLCCCVIRYLKFRKVINLANYILTWIILKEVGLLGNLQVMFRIHRTQHHFAYLLFASEKNNFYA